MSVGSNYKKLAEKFEQQIKERGFNQAVNVLATRVDDAEVFQNLLDRAWTKISPQARADMQRVRNLSLSEMKANAKRSSSRNNQRWFPPRPDQDFYKGVASETPDSDDFADSDDTMGNKETKEKEPEKSFFEKLGTAAYEATDTLTGGTLSAGTRLLESAKQTLKDDALGHKKLQLPAPPEKVDVDKPIVAQELPGEDGGIETLEERGAPNDFPPPDTPMPPPNSVPPPAQAPMEPPMEPPVEPSAEEAPPPTARPFKVPKTVGETMSERAEYVKSFWDTTERDKKRKSEQKEESEQERQREFDQRNLNQATQDFIRGRKRRFQYGTDPNYLDQLIGGTSQIAVNSAMLYAGTRVGAYLGGPFAALAVNMATGLGKSLLTTNNVNVAEGINAVESKTLQSFLGSKPIPVAETVARGPLDSSTGVKTPDSVVDVFSANVIPGNQVDRIAKDYTNAYRFAIQPYAVALRPAVQGALPFAVPP